LTTIVGWDIGGVNVKAASLVWERGAAKAVQVSSRPFEIWRAKDSLPEVLHGVLAQVSDELPQAMAVTMTAELSDVFVTKREGVLYVADTLLATFPRCASYALDLSGKFAGLAEARARPLDFAAANWLATALFVARSCPNCLLIDSGSTTTDIIPIVNGQVACQGRTDMDRLMAGELVYTGALRTHLAAIVHAVPVRGRSCPVSSEYFASSGDVHLILGQLRAEDYVFPAPDGRPPTIESARQRLARLVCADAEMLSAAEIDEMARYIYQQQLGQISAAILQVRSRFADRAELPVVAMGSGAFMAVEASRRLGLTVLDLAAPWGQEESAVAPCVAVAQLLAEHIEARR
jgi:(4-(4-[2-(gamma-L-glutamylamino)ethyl]phenoxymethyl)furan-2-yl)methanamine synthase